MPVFPSINYCSPSAGIHPRSTQHRLFPACIALIIQGIPVSIYSLKETKAMKDKKEQFIEAAVDVLLGMDTEEMNQERIVDATHSFSYVFRALQSALDGLKETGMDTAEVYECMNKALGRTMTRTNTNEEYDYMIALIQKP